MVEYIKNNKVTLIVVTVIVILASVLVVQSNQKVEELTESQSHSELLILKKDSVHVKDSLYSLTLIKECDSLAKLVRKYQSKESEETTTQNGKSKTTTTTVTTDKNGNSTSTTTVVEVDTTKIISKKVKEVVDSMSSIIEQLKKDVRYEKVYVHDTTRVKEEVKVEVHDTLYREKKVYPEPKKFLLAGSAGVGSTGDLKVLPDIQLEGRYTVWGPIFLRGGTTFMGNPITGYADPGNYRVGAGVGAKLEF